MLSLCYAKDDLELLILLPPPELLGLQVFSTTMLELNPD